jgi:heptosyltransferase-2
MATSHHAGYIAVAIGAALNTKKMPVHKLAALCAGINHPIILLGGKEDAANGDIIAQTDIHKIYNACGKFSLNESADLVRRSKFIITHDTGLMHIAAAFNKHILSVWGNTVPEFGMTAYYSNKNSTDTRFEVHDLRCRPCSKIGYSKCPRGHFKCMENISVKDIIDKTEQLLGR